MTEEPRGRGRSLARAHSANSIHAKPNPHAGSIPRSNSAQEIRKTLIKSDDLRQMAVRNGLRSSQLSLAMSRAQSLAPTAHNQQFPNKNIAMVPHEAKARPNWENNWSSFTLTQSTRSPARSTSVSSRDQKTAKSSVSPLAKLGSTTSRTTPPVLETIMSPPSQGHPSSDNRFDDLRDAKPNRFLSYPQTPQDDEFLHKRSSDIKGYGLKLLDSSVHVASLKSISDLDSSDHDDDALDKDTDVSLLEDGGDLTTPSSILSMAEEIQAFQKSFTGSVPQIKPTRTQRKVLEFRDLCKDETPKAGQPCLGSLDHTGKIQHEKIFAEWTQVRLRFSSHLQSKSTARCGAGVLGFVDRYLNRGWPVRSTISTNEAAVRKETKDSFLLSLWNSQQSDSPCHTYTQPQVSGAENAHHASFSHIQADSGTPTSHFNYHRYNMVP